MRRMILLSSLAGCAVADARLAPFAASSPAAHDGAELFFRTWTAGDPRARGGDGLGPLHNESSCAACHGLGGPGGGGSAAQNVQIDLALGRAAVRHRYTTDPSRAPVRVSPAKVLERNPSALFGAGLLDVVSDRVLERVAAEQEGTEVSGRVGRDADGRVARFGWKAEVADLSGFVAKACAVELGLEVPGASQVMPVLMEPPPGYDMDSADLAALTLYVGTLPAPERLEVPGSEQGQAVFGAIGCGGCHVEDLGPVKGVFSDLLRHHMGPGLDDKVPTYYGPDESLSVSTADTDEWRTPPLWGVRDSGPWLHDGRAETLHDAILAHGGEGQTSRERYVALSSEDRLAVVTFLRSLAAPRPR
jgi:CxxC motif-containing protein (DUF1111 family)